MKLLLVLVLVCLAIGEGSARRRGNWRRWNRCSRYYSSSSAGFPEPDLPDCGATDSWVEEDECRCDAFYMCAGGTIRHLFCPPGTLLQLDGNGDPVDCLPAFEVDCGGRSSRFGNSPVRFIQVTITVDDNDGGTTDPTYTITVPRLPLIDIMRLLDQKDATFSFASISVPFLGEKITTINGKVADNGASEVWLTKTSDGSLVSLGVSSYIPRNNDNIVFEFATI